VAAELRVNRFPLLVAELRRCEVREFAALLGLECFITVVRKSVAHAPTTSSTSGASANERA
jgi:hypothetical protein